MTEMRRQEPTPDQIARLRDAIRDLAWDRARELSGLQGDTAPSSPFDDRLDAEGQRAAVLAQLAALREVRDLADQLIDLTVTTAGTTGAGGQAIGDALNVTRAAVRQRYPDAIGDRPGPRKAALTDYGRAAWTDSTNEDGAAERDWLIRARVRMLRDASTGGAGTRREVTAGETLEMVMRGRAGQWVATDCWQTDEPPLQALFVYDHHVKVLEILEETSPWHDRGLGLGPITPCAEESA